MGLKHLIERLKNTGTIITLASLIILILTTNGLSIDNERVMTTVKALCSIGAILGILNNPDTAGLDIPGLLKGKDKSE